MHKYKNKCVKAIHLEEKIRNLQKYIFMYKYMNILIAIYKFFVF